MNTSNISAGVLIYRKINGFTEFLLVHPGGPFYAKKDLGVWTIPKGKVEEGESIEKAARREFNEETGLEILTALTAIGSIFMKSGKQIYAFIGEQDLDLSNFKSNSFEVHGKIYPEIDNISWFDLSTAKLKLHPAQHPFLDSVQ